MQTYIFKTEKNDVDFFRTVGIIFLCMYERISRFRNG